MKLKALVAQYVAFRKSLGARFEHTEGRLNAFCRFMGEEIDLADVKAERVQAFLAGTGPITRGWQERYGRVSGFYRYAISRGFAATSPLRLTKPKLPPAFIPIFTRTLSCANSSPPLLLLDQKDLASLNRTRCAPSYYRCTVPACASARHWLST
jgi:hypothetical protein